MDALNNLNLENNKPSSLDILRKQDKLLELVLIKFCPKVQKFVGRSRIYVLKYKDTIIFLGNKYNLDNQFRNILKNLYGEKYLVEYPDNFFKRYIEQNYKLQVEKSKKTKEKKQKYYSERRIKQKEKQIEKLSKEIEEEKENLKKLKRRKIGDKKGY